MTISADVPTTTRPVRRARRFLIVAPVRFREDRGEWVSATTVNMGRLGLLIRTRVTAPPATRLEMRVALGGESDTTGSYVACVGRVLRLERRDGEEESLMAVTIDDCHLRPAARLESNG